MTASRDLVLLAVDLGGTKVALATAGRSATGPHPYVEFDQFATPATAAEALASLLTAARRLVGDRTPIGIGVSFGGYVRDNSARQLMSRHVPGWQDIDLPTVLTRELGAPTLVANDADTAARGEYACLPTGQRPTMLVYLTVSTGVGGAVLIDGRTHRGRHGLAGEIGHLLVQPRGPVCSCGAGGHLEALASGPAIARSAVAGLRAEPRQPTLLRAVLAARGSLSAEDVDRAARHGDAFATRLLGGAGALMGNAVATIALLLDPDLVLIGGGVAQAGNAFWRPLRRAARAGALRMPNLRPAQLGRNSAVCGALELARDAADAVVGVGEVGEVGG